MAVIEQTVSLRPDTVAAVQAELRAQGLEAWLLFNFRGSNPIASQLLGLPAMTRRYAVLLRAEGAPVALTHGMEQQPWSSWIGERRVYRSWQQLEAELGSMLDGFGAVAMEVSDGDAVPYVDLVPAGVAELVRAAGVEIRSSAELVSAFYARWSAEGVASHRRAAVIVRETVAAAFREIAARVERGEGPTEWEARAWIRDQLQRRGLAVGADAIVAVNANAANPHFSPMAEETRRIRQGDLVLIDLWGKEREDAVYADQTWMGYLGDRVPDRLAAIWAVLTSAREAALELLDARHRAGQPISGFEVDGVVRGIVSEAGYGEFFVHRTGHSIDRELHGCGPNLDDLETRDTRELIRGIGFSIEPGIYIPGDVGFRTEINVFMGADGPEVTTPGRQQEIFALFAE